MVGKAQPDASIAVADRARSDPDHLTARAQLVERCGAVAGHSCRQQVALDRGRHERCTRQHAERLDQRLGPATVAGDAVPRRQEARQRLGFDRLDLTPQRRQRATPQLAQDVGVAPLTLDAIWPELAAHQPVVGGERRNRALDPLERYAEAPGDIVGEERSVGAGEAGDELLERARHGLGERHREPERERAPERIAVAGSVLGGGEARLAGDHELDRPPLLHQLGKHAGAVAFGAQVDLGRGQVADLA